MKKLCTNSHIAVNANWLSPSSILTESECSRTHNPQLQTEKKATCQKNTTERTPIVGRRLKSKREITFSGKTITTKSISSSFY
jgi:hypothetical protein